jgi:hypothetical protein
MQIKKRTQKAMENWGGVSHIYTYTSAQIDLRSSYREVMRCLTFSRG